VVFRRRGTLLPLERSVLEVAVRSGADGVYGFLLAQELAGQSGETHLVAHGTLYKALDRLRRSGLLDADWEDAVQAATAGRPRRRIYRITAAGQEAVRAGQAGTVPQAQPGEAPA
jgi:PadR family transcriptional regulator, regulatory protein PadR